MSHYVRVGGVWKKSNKLYTRQSGAWKEIINGYVKVSGVWKKFHTAITPPSAVRTDARDAGTSIQAGATFTSVALGTAAASRYIVVLAYAGVNAAASVTVTINGTAMTLLKKDTTVGKVRAFGLAVPTGTTATVVIANGTTKRAGWAIVVYACYDLASTTPYAAGITAFSGTGTTCAVNVNVPAGGILLGDVVTSYGATTYPITLSGATEDYSFTGGGYSRKTILENNTAVATGRTITGTAASGTKTFSTLVLTFI